ncbi:MAG: response regulator [Flammeovirgaceae bacterium]
MNEPIHILIADDHKIFREGLISLFEREPQIQVVGEAKDTQEILKALEKQMVQVILMDVDMGGSNGIDATTIVKTNYPEVQVLALTMHAEQEYILRMLDAGAIGYILKNTGKQEMLTAIKAVAAGETYYSQQVSATLIQHLRQPSKAKVKKEGIPLTKRELEVLRLIVEECSNTEIAEKLFISIRTVDTHRRNLIQKLGVKNTAGLVKYAIQNYEF